MTEQVPDTHIPGADTQPLTRLTRDGRALPSPARDKQGHGEGSSDYAITEMTSFPPSPHRGYGEGQRPCREGPSAKAAAQPAPQAVRVSVCGGGGAGGAVIDTRSLSGSHFAEVETFCSLHGKNPA